MTSPTPLLKKYQKQERLLSAVLVTVALVSPIILTYMMEKKWHWALSATTGFSILMLALCLVRVKNSIAYKIKKEYERLDIGYILAKKSKTPQRFVITNTGYNHYYLKSLETGEQLLVSRQRAREDFDIAL